MGVGVGSHLYMYDVVVKRSRSLSHLLMRSCFKELIYSQTRRRIFTRDGSNDADPRKDVPFGGFFHIAPYLGDQNPKKLQFGA